MIKDETKTLFCIIGNLRAGPLPCKSFYFHFPNVDLALCVGNTYPDSPWRSLAKYIWEVEDDQPFWEQAYDDVSVSWRDFTYLGENNLWAPSNGNRGSGMLQAAFRQILYNRLIENNIKYDRYVLTRADHMYTSGSLPETQPNSIYVPHGENYGGITDRFSVASHESFLKSLQFIEFIQQNWRGKDKNFEFYLNKFYEHQGLNIISIPRTMFVVARKDEQTRWMPVREDLPTKYKNHYLKYPKEYDMAIKNKSKQYHQFNPDNIKLIK